MDGTADLEMDGKKKKVFCGQGRKSPLGVDQNGGELMVLTIPASHRRRKRLRELGNELSSRILFEFLLRHSVT